ncbi:uncharacterized protein LOC112568734 [Pomacea canaliculata]|uniref:uncharacterized protein LOC112568734 n=1 Tax=Pomacea canaliculata TaxID=400727 RepID=UPI000D7342CC|nr:uncharacterized protein LOC112568734 [Pomacea canaliculata]
MLVSTSALRQTTTKPKTIPSSTSKPTTISPRFGTIPGPRLPETKPHNTYHSTARETKHSTKATTHRLRAMPSSTSDFRQTTTKLRTIPSSTSTPTTTLRKSHRLYDSFELKFLNDSPSVTVENGVESHLDFFLRDFASLNKLIRIIVQYQRSGGNYDNKCQMKHSKTSGCTVLFGPCECVGEQSGSFRYRLKMNFTEQDSGSLHFSIVDHNSFFVNVNVVSAVHATQYLTRPTTHQYKAMPVSTSAPLTTTIRPTTIPFSTTTPTTTSTMVDLATKAATRHLELDTPDPLKTEADNHNGGTEDEPESEEALQSNGSSIVVMNFLTISFILLASHWGL